MKKQKENSHEGIAWSEMGKQNVQAEKVYCGKLEVAFKASPSSQHQHCTDEAQKAETVLSAVIYRYMCKFFSFVTKDQGAKGNYYTPIFNQEILFLYMLHL